MKPIILPITGALLALSACAGGGPLGTGLGEVVANIAVTDGHGATCTVSLTNGKDQTGLTLKGLHVCGGTLDELHADKSDGAAAAIAANAAVATRAIDASAATVKDAIGLAGIAAGLPPVPVAPRPALAADPDAALQQRIRDAAP